MDGTGGSLKRRNQIKIFMKVGVRLTALRLGRDVLQKDARGLDKLQVHVPIIEMQNAREVLHHILLAKQVEIRSPVLLRKDDVLSQIPDHFDVELLVLVVDLSYAL